MKTIITFFNKLRFSEKHIPWLLLAVHILAFGLLIPFLGYYQDDWHFVYYAFARGNAGLMELFNYDGHPLESGVYMLAFQLLGFKPLAWHIFSLFSRWLATLSVWLVFREIWPKRTKEILSAVLLFTIYPFFSLQAQAISYSGLWVSYFLLSFSFYFMLKAIKTPEKFWLYTLLAFFIKAVQLTTAEYFTGLELVRPVLIWMILASADSQPWRQKLWKTIKLWMPYLVITVIYMIWRIFIFQPPVATQNDAIVISELLAHPFSTARYILFHSIPDFVLILFTTWSNILNPSFFDFSNRTNLLVFLLAVVGFVIALVFLGKLRQGTGDESARDWPQQALGLGAIALVLSMLPAYAADYFVTLENPPWNSRFSVAATFGAVLILVGLLHILVQSGRARNILIALLFGLSVGWHIQNANGFRWAWEKQVRFYEQLTWRAPAVETNTAFISDQEVLPYMGDYPMAFAVNAIYAQTNSQTGDQIPYWYYIMTRNFPDKLDELFAGTLTQRTRKHSMVFQTDFSRSLILSFEPEQGQCLWLMRPQDVNSPYLPAHLQSASQLSTLDVIQVPQPNTLMGELFGNGQTDTWCYYFEKADLARQNLDWKTATDLWQSANKSGLSPNSGEEYLPFIEAFVHTDDWKTARVLTERAYQAKKGLQAPLCKLWSETTSALPASQARDQELEKVNELLSCGDL